MISLDNFIKNCQGIAKAYGIENVMVDQDGDDGIQFYKIVGKIKTSKWNKQGSSQSNWTNDTEDAWRKCLNRFDANCSIERGDETWFLQPI